MKTMFVGLGNRVDYETELGACRSLSLAEKAAWLKLEKQTSRSSIVIRTSANMSAFNAISTTSQYNNHFWAIL
jgi:hypothetical protein